MSLGKQIAKQRKLHQLSQEQLANKMKVSRQTIARWESDITVPDYNKIIDLSKVFGISVNELLAIQETRETINQDVLLSLFEQFSLNQAKMYKHFKNTVFIAALVFVVVIISVIFGTQYFLLSTTKRVDNAISQMEATIHYPVYNNVIEAKTYVDSFEWVCKERTNEYYRLQLKVNLKEYQVNTQASAILYNGNSEPIEIPLEKIRDGEYLSKEENYTLDQQEITLKLKLADDSGVKEELLANISGDGYNHYYADNLIGEYFNKELIWNLNYDDDIFKYELNPVKMYIEPCFDGKIGDGFYIDFTKKEDQKYQTNGFDIYELMKNKGSGYLLMTIEEANGYKFYCQSTTFQKAFGGTIIFGNGIYGYKITKEEYENLKENANIY